MLGLLGILCLIGGHMSTSGAGYAPSAPSITTSQGRHLDTTSAGAISQGTMDARHHDPVFMVTFSSETVHQAASNIALFEIPVEVFLTVPHDAYSKKACTIENTINEVTDVITTVVAGLAEDTSSWPFLHQPGPGAMGQFLEANRLRSNSLFTLASLMITIQVSRSRPFHLTLIACLGSPLARAAMDTDKVQPEILKDVGIETSALKFELAIRNNATDKKGGRIRGGGGGGLTSGSSGETENLSIQWIWGTAFATTAALLLCENSVLSFASVFFDTAHASPVSNDWTRREAILTRVSETNDSCDIADFKGEGGSSIVGERGEDMERHHSDSRSWLLHRLSMNQNMAILPLALNFLSMSMAKVKIGARSSISLFLIYLAFLQTVRASAPMADDFNGVPPPEHNTTALILDQSIPGCTSTFACGPNNQASASNGIPSMLFPVGAALVISTFLSGPEIGRWLAILGFPLTALASAVPEPTYGFAIETTKAPLSTPMLVMTSVTYPQLLQDDIASTSDLNDDSDIFQGYSTDHHNSSTHASAHKKPPRKTGTAESSRGANPAGDSPDPTVAHELRDHWNAVATPIEFVEGGVGLFGLPAINCCAPLPSATVAPSAAS